MRIEFGMLYKFKEFLKAQGFQKINEDSFSKDLFTNGEEKTVMSIILNVEEGNASYEIMSKDTIFNKIIYSGFDQDVFKGYAKAIDCANEMLLNFIKRKLE